MSERSTQKPIQGVCYFNQGERCHSYFDEFGIERNGLPCVLENMTIPDGMTAADVFAILRLAQGLTSPSNMCKKTDRALVQNEILPNTNQENKT